MSIRASTPPREQECQGSCPPSPDPICPRGRSRSSTPKRRRDSEGLSRSPCTPFRRAKVDLGTPTPVRVVLEQLNENGVPSVPAMNQVLTCLRDIGEENPQEGVRCARRLYDSLFPPSKPEQNDENDENVLKKHRSFLGFMEERPPFAHMTSALRGIESKFDPFSPSLCTFPVCYDHLVAPDEKGRGWHLLRKGDCEISLVNPVVSVNGTLFAGFSVSKGVKYSTFFPPERISSLAQLDGLIQKNRHFERIGNRGLCYSQEQDLYFEVYYKNNECITTAYPFFFVGKYQEDQDYSIIRNAPPVSSKDVLSTARTLVEAYASADIIPPEGNPIRYCVLEANEEGEAEFYLYIDISNWLSDNYSEIFHKALRGILFRMPKSLFDDISKIDIIAKEA